MGRQPIGGGNHPFWNDELEPREGTENEVEMECENPEAEGHDKTYRVYIESSEEYDVTVNARVIGDQIGALYSTAGLHAIVAHEQRRLTAYGMAYQEYLEIFEDDITDKCGKTGIESHLAATQYKKALEDWLNNKQSEAKSRYKSWAKLQQTGITKENNGALDQNGGKWVYGENIFNSFSAIHQYTDFDDMDWSCPQ